MSISLKEYRKAYYKMNARNKVEVTFEGPNTKVAKFLFHQGYDKYLELFGNSMEPLIKGSKLKISLGVIRNGENIVGVFFTDGGGAIVGDLKNVSLPRKVEEILEFYHVSR